MTTNIPMPCTHNSARSVPAEAMLDHRAGMLGRDLRAFSAGSTRSGRIDACALETAGNCRRS
jgi:arsenate reductase